MHTTVLSLCEWIRAQGEGASDLILCEHVSFIEESIITVFSEILFHHSFYGFGNIAYKSQGGRESKGGREDP